MPAATVSTIPFPAQKMPPAEPVPARPLQTAAIPFPTPPAPSAPASAPEPPSPPAPLPAVAPETPKSQSTAEATPLTSICAIFGQPGKGDWTLKEIVQKTAKLPGVSGALVAMQDGLLAAAEMPENLKPETIAAFLPQVFGRLGQYARQLEMGTLSRATLHCDGADWLIFKSGTVYFLAAGCLGKPLPGAQLEIIATELGKQENT
jgi:predicted regulator of Ras-like GTPase activity (Roadblock/LC7/MglB family)